MGTAGPSASAERPRRMGKPPIEVGSLLAAGGCLDCTLPSSAYSECVGLGEAPVFNGL